MIGDMDTPPTVTSVLASVVAHVGANLGEILVTSGLALIAWVMSTFTARHINSMDQMTKEIKAISLQVVSLSESMKYLSRRQDEQHERIRTLEDHEHK